MKILVVDHSKVFRALWHRLVTAAGHEPIMASSGTEGMRYLYERKVELVCVSRVLPDMDGIDFCRGVRATRLGNDLPLILLTASQDNEFRRQAFEAGVTDIHSKTNIQDLFNQAERYGRSVQQGASGRVLYVEDSTTVAVSHPVARAGDRGLQRKRELRCDRAAARRRGYNERSVPYRRPSRL